MDAVELFLREHARVHSAQVAEAEAAMWLEDIVLGEMTDEQIRHRPHESMNSLAWIFWHMARAEDMGVNALVAGQPQVIEGDGWLEKLGLSRVDIGTGMSDDEVSDFSQRVDIATLRAYRAAVGRRTREVVGGLKADDWDQLIDTDAMERAAAAGAIGPNAGWLSVVFGGKTKALILSHVGASHNFWHLGEAMTVRSLAGQRLPF
ncbi:MAG: DinB family protein [Dehalococcoidia bacterium]